MNYTVFAYKEDGSCISMGCVVCTYGSDFIVEYFDNPLDTAKKVAELELKNQNAEEQEPTYSIKVLVNGRPIEDGDSYVYGEYIRLLEIEGVKALTAQLEAETLKETEEEAKKARATEEARQREVAAFFATGKKLGYEIQPK